MGTITKIPLHQDIEKITIINTGEVYVISLFKRLRFLQHTLYCPCFIRNLAAPLSLFSDCLPWYNKTVEAQLRCFIS